MNTQLHRLHDNARSQTKHIIVKSELENRTTRPLVQRAVRMNVHIDDVLEHLNGYPEIEAEEVKPAEHTVTTGEDQ